MKTITLAIFVSVTLLSNVYASESIIAKCTNPKRAGWVQSIILKKDGDNVFADIRNRDDGSEDTILLKEVSRDFYNVKYVVQGEEESGSIIYKFATKNNPARILLNKSVLVCE